LSTKNSSRTISSLRFIWEHLDTIFSAAKHLYQADISSGNNIKHKSSSQKAVETVAKSIAQIKSFLDSISTFGITFMASQSKKSETKGAAQISSTKLYCRRSRAEFELS